MINNETRESEAYCVSKSITVIPEEAILAVVDNANTDSSDVVADNQSDNNTDVTDNNDIKNPDIDSTVINPLNSGKLKNVYFDFDKYNIRKDAKEILDENITTLKSNTSYKVKIIAHTDSRGPDVYNQLLSEKRAKAVREYLVNNGIEDLRIIESSGKGEKELVNNCKDETSCSKDDHQLNRRSEIVIIY
jgi:outer membrane protein OmpA-like peptidoglycan-associated protein